MRWLQAFAEHVPAFEQTRVMPEAILSLDAAPKAALVTGARGASEP